MELLGLPGQVPDRISPERSRLPALALDRILVTSSWEEAEKKLAAGGKVLFVPRNLISIGPVRRSIPCPSSGIA